MPAVSFNERLAAHANIKVGLSVVLSVFFCVPYFLLGFHPIFPVRSLPLTRLDVAIGFHPIGWTWVYQSFYIPLDGVPWLLTTRHQLRRYVSGFLALSILSFTAFFFFPVRAPKPSGAVGPAIYQQLQRYDPPNNSFPSLHVALLVFTIGVSRRALPGWLQVVLMLWMGAVAVSTLMTKEHYVVDVVAGAALGFAATVWTWRSGAGEVAQHIQQ